MAAASAARAALEVDEAGNVDLRYKPRLFRAGPQWDQRMALAESTGNQAKGLVFPYLCSS